MDTKINEIGEALKAGMAETAELQVDPYARQKAIASGEIDLKCDARIMLNDATTTPELRAFLNEVVYADELNHQSILKVVAEQCGRTTAVLNTVLKKILKAEKLNIQAVLTGVADDTLYVMVADGVLNEFYNGGKWLIHDLSQEFYKCVDNKWWQREGNNALLKNIGIVLDRLVAGGLKERNLFSPEGFLR